MGEVLEIPRKRTHAERMRYFFSVLGKGQWKPGPDSPREQARAILDALPTGGELNYHGADGRPCPCSSCASAAARFLSVNGLLK